ncbi:MAG: divalent-cation tolerance protein CutA [Alphaproteobacteria bacterium]
MSDFLSVHITASTRAEAETIARNLVNEGLSACVNIVTDMRSIYRWEGKAETAHEVLLIAKTTTERFADLEKRVKDLHSHKCPCIVAMPITAAHQPYLDWLAAETKS